MEEQNFNLAPEKTEKSKTKYWKFVLGFLGIMVLVGGGFWVWDRYFSQQAKINRETQRNYEKYLEWQKNYEKAMQEDTYGGKTPEETLQMFIEALKKEDIELASRYFILREDGTPDPIWKEALIKAKSENKLPEIINILLQAKPDPQAAISEDYYVFSARDKNGIVIADIDLRFNKYSGVWKIESL
jgi:hypothetical protein